MLRFAKLAFRPRSIDTEEELSCSGTQRLDPTPQNSQESLRPGQALAGDDPHQKTREAGRIPAPDLILNIASIEF